MNFPLNHNMADVPAESANAAENGKMSSKSSDISIEEIGPEDDSVEKVENPEVLIPEVEDETNEDEIEELVREDLPNPAPQDASIADEEDEEEDDDDFEDETLIERLVGLTEMFPEGLTSTLSATANGTVSSIKWLYGASRNVTWVVCSSAAIMFLPIMIETERLGIEEAQKMQQRQILLGPGAAMSGGNAQANAPLPNIA